MEEETTSIIYESPRLTMLVKRWINNNKIKKTDYELKTDNFKNKLKELTKILSKEPAPFEFNKISIFKIIDEHHCVK